MTFHMDMGLPYGHGAAAPPELAEEDLRLVEAEGGDLG